MHWTPRIGVAKFLHVPAGRLHGWLPGRTVVPAPVPQSLVELMDSEQRRR